MINYTCTLIDENKKTIMQLHPLEEAEVSVIKQKTANGEIKNETRRGITMKKLKLTQQQIHNIYDECSERFVVTEEEDWVSHGKYETKYFIFKDTETGCYYDGVIYRTGDYWSGYTALEDGTEDEILELQPLEKVEVTVTEWKPIKDEFETEDLTNKEV